MTPNTAEFFNTFQDAANALAEMENPVTSAQNVTSDALDNIIKTTKSDSFFQSEYGVPVGLKLTQTS